jgi:hypothetical protein
MEGEQETAIGSVQGERFIANAGKLGDISICRRVSCYTTGVAKR